MKDYAEILQQAAQLLEKANKEQAWKLLQKEYPFSPKVPTYNPVYKDVALLGLTMPTALTKKVGNSQKGTRKKLSYKQKFEIFERDGFRCRYSGIRLVLPPALLLLSLLMPKVFPCKNYENCPLDRTHVGIWTLSPCLDHVKPFSNGGSCTPDNLITVSSSVNTVKANYCLEDLGWVMLHPDKKYDDWDGLGRWFLGMIGSNPKLISELLSSSENQDLFSKGINGIKFFSDWTKVLEEYFSLY